MRDIDPALRLPARILRFVSPPNRSEASLRRRSWFLDLARHMPGCNQGFDGIAPRAAVSRRALASQVAWLRMAVSRYAAPQPSPAPGEV